MKLNFGYAKSLIIFTFLALLVTGVASAKDWSIDASLVEACSCRVFCPCYFQPFPDRGGMCDFNIIYTVNEGHYGDVKIDGVRVWLAGNLEGDGSAFHGSWLTIAFDPSVTKEQQDATIKILTKIYPLEWNVLAVETKPIVVKYEGEVIDAEIPGAHLKMQMNKGADGKTPVVLRNLQYFPETENDGFYVYRTITHK